MGCDIHDYAEVRRDNRWVYADSGVIECRNYGWFGFLANVRNDSHSPVIAEPRGLPNDLTPEVVERWDLWQPDARSASWLTLAELQEHDYDQDFWDRDEDEHLTLREFLGPRFFARLDELAKLGAPEDVRLVFWFDN